MVKAILNGREIFGNVHMGEGEPFPDAILTGRTNFGGFFSIDGIDFSTGNRFTNFTSSPVNTFGFCTLTNANATAVTITALVPLKLVVYSCDGTDNSTESGAVITTTKTEYTLGANESVNVAIKRQSAFAYMALIYLT